MTTPNITPQETALLESVAGYSGYTESEAKVKDRWARWCAKADMHAQEKLAQQWAAEQAKINAAATEFALWRIDRELESLEDLDAIESSQIDGKPVFGSAKWFEDIPEVKF